MDVISVIIPVYNTAEYLPRCLDSVLNNTYQHLEVICIDDGSTDNSADVLQEYAKRDSRMVIITQANAGVSAARNAGLDWASGEFVAFIDSDDWVQISYFDRLIYAQKKYDADIVACGFTRAYGNTVEEGAETNAEQVLTVAEALQNAHIKRTVWGKLYKRALLRTIRFDTKLVYGEDTTFNLLLFSQNQNVQIAQIQRAIYVYFDRGGRCLILHHGKNNAN